MSLSIFHTSNPIFFFIICNSLETPNYALLTLRVRYLSGS
jgi:hypothetical protein